MSSEDAPADALRQVLRDVEPRALVRIGTGSTTLLSMTAAGLRSAIVEASGVRLPPIFLIYALRYALGRRSYAAADVAEALIAHRDHLQARWREQIVLDIDEALRAQPADMPQDVDRWVRVREAMQP